MVWNSSARIPIIPISSTTRDQCYVDLGQLYRGQELLHRCLQLAPGHSHACVALALGYQRAGDLLRARECTMQALAADPSTFMPKASLADRSQCHLEKNRLFAPMIHFPDRLAPHIPQ